MKYWLIPFLVCAGAAQANAEQAGNFGGGLFILTPGFIGTNISNKFVSATAGVQGQQNNNLNVQQNSLANFVGVQQVSSGNAPTNNANIGQSGQANYVGLGQASLGKPGSTQVNNAAIGQAGPQDHVSLNQTIPTSLPLPSMGAP